MFCHQCGSEAEDDAAFCHKCGQQIRSATTSKSESIQETPATRPVAIAVIPPSPLAFKRGNSVVVNGPVAKTYTTPLTGTAAVRQGMTQAKFNDDNSSIMTFEMMVIAIVAGVIASSWWWFGGVFAVFIAMMAVKPLAKILAFVLSVGWGLLGYGIGVMLDSQSASVVLALLAFCAGLGVHFSAIQWFRDV